MTARRRSCVKDAVAAVAGGRAVVVLDGDCDEGGGDLVIAAAEMSAQRLGFLLQHTAGVVRVALLEARLDQLALPTVRSRRGDDRRSEPTEPVDSASGGDGASVGGRAATIRALADPASRRGDFVWAGHVHPLRGRPRGVLERACRAEAAIDLARLGGWGPAGVLCEIVTADKTAAARGPELLEFALRHALPVVSIGDLVRYRLRTEPLVRLAAQVPLPTRYGTFACHGWESLAGTGEYVALTYGVVAGGGPVLVHAHRACPLGDVFASRRCGCGARLERALQSTVTAGRGVVLYARGPAGRGLDLDHAFGKRLPDAALSDTECAVAAQMLRDLGVDEARLAGADSATRAGLAANGVDVAECLCPAHDSAVA